MKPKRCSAQVRAQSAVLLLAAVAVAALVQVLADLAKRFN